MVALDNLDVTVRVRILLSELKFSIVIYMGKRSIIYNFTKEQLQKIANESNSLSEIMHKVGLAYKGGNHSTLKRILCENKIDLTILNANRESFLDKKRQETHFLLRLPDSEIFCENSKAARKEVKARIIKNNLIEYKCRDCGNIGWWNNKLLTLQLEHINGIPNDNRLENLCFLCPSCHSQTDTYSGKKLRKITFEDQQKLNPKKDIIRKFVNKKVKHYLPKELKFKSSIKHRKLSEENIQFILCHKDDVSKLQMSKMFGVSDKTIAKIIKNNGYII